MRKSKESSTSKTAVRKNAIKAVDELLHSDDEKIKMQAAKLILSADCKKKEKEKDSAPTPSPYEIWLKENGSDGQAPQESFKEYWFNLSGYTPHNAQRLAHTCDKRFIVCISGRRFGKSLMASKEAEAVLVQPNKRVWIVAPTYNLTDKVFREIYKTFVLDRRIDPKSIVKKAEGEQLIKLAWGSEVVGKSADNPASLIGEGVDYLIFDECAKVKKRIWEKYLRPTLTDRNGRALFITTPEGRNWVYQLYLRGLEKDDPNWQAFSFQTEENPHINKDDILEAKRTLSADVFNQEYCADFFSFSGRVYKEFVATAHVDKMSSS